MLKNLFCVAAAVLAVLPASGQPAAGPEEVCPGVWRFRIGIPESITPVTARHSLPATNALAALAAVPGCPVAPTGSLSPRGCLISLPLAQNELVYGLGLQFQSFQQRGTKKMLRVNADPRSDSGDSHAPVPFYVTTRGYGVLVDTARYATFYCGDTQPKPQPAGTASGKDTVKIEIPRAQGVDVYIFAGPSLREAVQRYNLFSGGGPLPPRWGLGFWYRCDADFDQTNVLRMASALREEQIPCDVLGLEPRWQTHSYPCSFVWSDKFPNPAAMIAELQTQHYHLNLWEHAFTHPSSPIYQPLLAHSGDYEVWGGLVPDFLDADARKIFGDFQEKEHVAIGASGYKLDECDNSDFTGGWSFPEFSRFPSGADGEQMHSLFGLRYQDAIQGIFDKRRQRTYGLVRSSQALATPYPYALYSDLYDHSEFIHAVAQAGFCGLLWTPEVREAANPRELIRRLQAVVFSPLAMINAWYLKNPPWKQVNRAANNAGQFSPDAEQVEAQCRAIIELRMKFLPYLHAAFVRYHQDGTPPFRALVMDYPNDIATKDVDDEYLMGENVLVAPVAAVSAERPHRAEGKHPPAAPETDAGTERAVYLPDGEWQDFWTGEHFHGRQTMTVSVPPDRIPLFVKAGTVLALAQPTLSTEDSDSWKLTALVFGDGSRSATLFEDDGSFEPQLTKVELKWDAAAKSGKLARSGSAQSSSYTVVAWKTMP